MKEKKQPPKQIKISHEAYTGLLKIGDESYSMTDRINHLLGEQPKKKIDLVPYAVAQASVIANMQEAKIEDGYFINRREVMKKVPEQLINLGWDKVHPNFFEDLKSWRCPIKVFLDNVIKGLVIKGIIEKHSTHGLIRNNRYLYEYSSKVSNYRANPNLDLNHYHEYLVSADDYLATYKGDSYSIRMTLEDVDHIELVRSKRWQ